MKSILWSILMCSLSVSLFATPNINSISDNGPVGRYSKFEVTYSLGTNVYSNPYDPNVINVTVTFAAPSGKNIAVDGFIYQGYTRTGNFNSQALTPSGSLVWKARFAPNETGTWSYRISANDGVAVTSAVRQFVVNSSVKKGFVKISKKDQRYFAFDNGDAFFPLGENLAWSGGSGGTYQYDAWVSALANAGANFFRMWQVYWFTEVEWANSYPANPVLPGNYSSRQGSAWGLDYTLDMAESNGVKVLLCLMNNMGWESNPLNSNINPNGVISSMQQYWTNMAVRLYSQRKLRYYISRYAYSTALFGWEMWNEIETLPGYNTANAASWHQATSDYIRSKDPYGHLISTSFGSTRGQPTTIWNSGMDFVQEHNYGGIDMASVVHSAASQLMALNPGKPFMMGEVGLNVAGNSELTYDPTGIYINEVNWGSLMSGCGGGAMPWWWDSYVHPNNVYYRWIGSANYARNEDLDAHGYVPVIPAVSTTSRADYAVSPQFKAWQPAPTNHFVVDPASGTLSPDESKLGDRLYSIWHPTERNPPTFHVNYAIPGKFRVYDTQQNSGVSNILRIARDGVTVLTRLTVQGGVYEIDVPAGPHTIYATIDDGDWISVRYLFTDYVGMLKCYALRGGRKILGWVQSRNYTYWQQYNGEPLPVVADGIVNITGVTNGRWRVSWWDAASGLPQAGFSDYFTDSGNLNIAVPAVSRDIAFKAYYIGSCKIAGPTNNALFMMDGGSNLNISLSRLDPYSTITQTVLYANTNVVGVYAGCPQSLTWSNLATGIYDLHVVYIDSNGYIGMSTWTSSIVRITADLDTDSDNVRNMLDDDDDGDGMPDAWEMSNGLNPLVQDADADVDADGSCNLHEYIAGTCPTNSHEKFQIISVNIYAGGGNVIRWPSVSNRHYGVYWTRDLTDAFKPLLTNLNATPSFNYYTDTVHNAETLLFYKITVR